jgi:hypothetical protein
MNTVSVLNPHIRVRRFERRVAEAEWATKVSRSETGMVYFDAHEYMVRLRRNPALSGIEKERRFQQLREAVSRRLKEIGQTALAPPR